MANENEENLTVTLTRRDRDLIGVAIMMLSAHVPDHPEGAEMDHDLLELMNKVLRVDMDQEELQEFDAMLTESRANKVYEN